MAESGDNSNRKADDQHATSSRSVPGPLWGTGDPSVTVPRELQSLHHDRRKKLVLHIDLNNTILVSDSVTGQGTVATLDYFLSTVTWGKMNNHGRWEWLSDSPSLLPPCDDAVSYYSQFGRIPNFTSAAGKRFRSSLDEHLDLLRWPKGIKGDRELSVRGEDGRLYHWILPSFFQLLRDLVQKGREFAVLFRTFGTDLPRVLRAVLRALNESVHPLFPDLPDLKLSVNTTPGKIRCSKRGVVLSRAEERVSTQDGERGLYQYFSSVQGVGGFQDHFDWWARNTFSIHGGKPMLVDPFDPNVLHIFIDDNIRQNDEDTIVHPKVALTLVQPAPLSSMTSHWSRPTSSGPFQTRVTSPNASTSVWKTTRETSSRGQTRAQFNVPFPTGLTAYVTTFFADMVDCRSAVDGAVKWPAHQKPLWLLTPWDNYPNSNFEKSLPAFGFIQVPLGLTPLTCLSAIVCIQQEPTDKRI